MKKYEQSGKHMIDISTWSRRGNDYPLCVIGKMGDDICTVFHETQIA